MYTARLKDCSEYFTSTWCSSLCIACYVLHLSFYVVISAPAATAAATRRHHVDVFIYRRVCTLSVEFVHVWMRRRKCRVTLLLLGLIFVAEGCVFFLPVSVRDGVCMGLNTLYNVLSYLLLYYECVAVDRAVSLVVYIGICHSPSHSLPLGNAW